jgi:hypothetical protein
MVGDRQNAPGMSDDWRLTVTVQDEGVIESFLDGLREVGLERDARRRLGDRVVVSHDGPRIFLYTDREEDAREAERAIGPLMAKHKLHGDVVLHRWHPIEERWEDPSVPLPSTEMDREIEHEEREEAEARDARRSGFAEWEVRVDLPNRADAAALAERMKAEGRPVIRRFRFVLVAAANEDDANALAERLRTEVPMGAQVRAEGSFAWKVFADRPFAIFGGLGG